MGREGMAGMRGSGMGKDRKGKGEERGGRKRVVGMRGCGMDKYRKGKGEGRGEGRRWWG